MRRQGGAALVLVLWLIALMTALVGAFALSARVEHLQQRVLDDDARGQERARAGLEYALLRLSADPQRAPWRADGRTYRWQFDDASIEIKVLDENGKINLNRPMPRCWPPSSRHWVKTMHRPGSWPGPSSTGVTRTACCSRAVVPKRRTTPQPGCPMAHATSGSRPWASCSACWACAARCTGRCCRT